MKYPRMLHLPWSQGVARDDLVLESTDCFQDKRFIFFEKLDGECTSMSKYHIHARSEDGPYNKGWQTYIKSEIWSKIKHKIPAGMFIFGENMYAVHSIVYRHLYSYFFVFEILYLGRFLNFTDVLHWAKEFELDVAPVLQIGNIDTIKDTPQVSTMGDVCEGYVIRHINAFDFLDFNRNVAKCVRKNHVSTSNHWTRNWERAKLI